MPTRRTLARALLLLTLATLALLLLLCQPAAAGRSASTSSSEDYYKLLGVSRSATPDQIKRAFKKLVLEKHPDRNKADPNANALFMRINRAYEILKSPEMRQKYDRYGEEGIKAHEEEGQQQERHAGGGLFADDPQIVKLTPERYESIAKDARQIWFVNFYASQVKRSEKFAQMWREVGHELEDVIRVAAVDCQESGYLCENIPELRSAEPPVIFFFPGRSMYTGPLTKESLIAAALKRFTSEHVDLTPANLAATLARPGGPAHWLVAFCARGRDCFSQLTLKKLAAVFHDYVGIGRVDCGEEAELCARLNQPVVAGDDAVSARLFVNASAWASATVPPAESPGLPVASLHTQETARAVLRLLPPLAGFSTEVLARLTRAVFEGASLRSGHLLLLTDSVGDDGGDGWQQLKRLEPLLRPHRIRVGRLTCGSAAVAEDERELCRRLAATPPGGKGLPAAVMVKRTGAYEVFYGQLHYMDVKEFALTAAANPMTALNSETFAALVDSAPKDTVWLVDFFAPWCPPCMKALPEFREAARLYQDEMAPGLPADARRLRFGAVDCTVEKQLCNRIGINSYPSLLLLLGGARRVKFRGSKFAHQMLAFAEAFVQPVATYFTPETFKRTLEVATGAERTHAWMVYFHSVNCQPCVEFMPELNALAKNFREHAHIRVGAVDCVTHRDLCNSQGIRSYPTIRAFPADKTGTKDFFDYNSPFRDGDSVSAWLQGFAPQAVMRFTRRTFQSELATSEPWVVYFYAEWCGPCQAFGPTFKAVANSLGLYANFGKLDCDPYQDACVSKGIQSMPSVALFRNGKMLTHLTGQAVYSLESTVRSHFPEKRDKARVFYGYHGNSGGNGMMMDGGGGGDGHFRRVIIDNGGDGGAFFTMGDGMQFNFHHDEF